MNTYRIEYCCQHHDNIPIVIQDMVRPRFTKREFDILHMEASWLAKDVMDGYCRATVYLHGEKMFRYTIIQDEPDFRGTVTTKIWTMWPAGNYRSIRKLSYKYKED